MLSVPLENSLAIAAVLFAVGAAGVLLRRNVLFVLMSLEIMLNAAGFAFVAVGSSWAQADGQIMFILILTLAGAEVSIGLALILQIHHRFKTVDIDQLSEMKG